MLLLGVAVYVLIEAVRRFADPADVLSGWMLVVAIAGLVANLVAFALLREGAAESLNVEGAYLEVLADTVGSVGVIVAAVVLALTGWTWVDPVVAIAIGLWIVPRTLRLAGRAIRILVQAAPPGTDIDALRADLAAVDGVVDVHDLHVWTLTSDMDVASAHLMVAHDDRPPPRARLGPRRAARPLRHRPRHVAGGTGGPPRLRRGGLVRGVERGLGSRTDVAPVERVVQGDRPPGGERARLPGDDRRRRGVPRLRRRHRRQLDRPQPPARRRGDRQPGRPLHPRPGQRATPTTCSSRSPPASPSCAPARIDTFFFANSGAEITEAAVKLAKQVTGRPNVIVFAGSFHGRTHLTMAMTTSKTGYRAGHTPLPAGIFVAPFPDPLADDEDAEVERALRGLDHLLATMTAPAETAAMILEPVLGEGGYIPAPAAFIEGVVERCRAHGILFVADEVQIGLRPHRRDVRRRPLRHRARRHLHGQGHRLRLPVRRPRHAPRARRPWPTGQSRRHVRRQPDRVRRGAGDDRRADRAGLPRQRPRSVATS